jgi:hypothetical protein
VVDEEKERRFSLRLQNEEKKDNCEGDDEVEEKCGEDDEEWSKRGEVGRAKKKQKTTPKKDEEKEVVEVFSSSSSSSSSSLSSSQPLGSALQPLDDEDCEPSGGGRILFKKQESFASSIIASYPADETLEKTPIPQLQRALDVTVALADKLLQLINKKTEEAGGDYDLAF